MDVELERPELVLPGLALVLVGLAVSFSALTAYEVGMSFNNPRDQYLVGAAVIFAGVYMLDRVYGFVGR